jgi:hypothetical protein
MIVKTLRACFFDEEQEQFPWRKWSKKQMSSPGKPFRLLQIVLSSESLVPHARLASTAFSFTHSFIQSENERVTNGGQSNDRSIDPHQDRSRRPVITPSSFAISPHLMLCRSFPCRIGRHPSFFLHYQKLWPAGPPGRGTENKKKLRESDFGCCTNSDRATVYIYFKKHRTNTDTHICMCTHLYEHMYAHRTPMITSERLSRLDLKIHEVDHQERFTVDEDIASH